MSTYFFSPALLDENRAPEKGILSQTLYQDAHVKVVLFQFAAGNELSAHTAPMPATLYFLKGRGRLTLGTEPAREVSAGAFAHMTPNLPHAIVAEEPLAMLLVMIPGLRQQG